VLCLCCSPRATLRALPVLLAPCHPACFACAARPVPPCVLCLCCSHTDHLLFNRRPARPLPTHLHQAPCMCAAQQQVLQLRHTHGANSPARHPPGHQPRRPCSHSPHPTHFPCPALQSRGSWHAHSQHCMQHLKEW